MSGPSLDSAAQSSRPPDHSSPPVCPSVPTTLSATPKTLEMSLWRPHHSCPLRPSPVWTSVVTVRPSWLREPSEPHELCSGLAEGGPEPQPRPWSTRRHTLSSSLDGSRLGPMGLPWVSSALRLLSCRTPPTRRFAGLPPSPQQRGRGHWRYILCPPG